MSESKPVDPVEIIARTFWGGSDESYMRIHDHKARKIVKALADAGLAIVADRAAPSSLPPASVESVARIIASHIGLNYDRIFENKAEWTKNRGMRDAEVYDINTPYRTDLRDAAKAVLAHVSPSSLPLKRTDPPTEDGWYWAGLPGERPEPIYVTVLPDKGPCGCRGETTVPVSAWPRWYGPLALPIPEVEP